MNDRDTTQTAFETTGRGDAASVRHGARGVGVASAGLGIVALAAVLLVVAPAAATLVGGAGLLLARNALVDLSRADSSAARVDAGDRDAGVAVAGELVRAVDDARAIAPACSRSTDGSAVRRGVFGELAARGDLPPPMIG
jgi:hypothetical protein